MKKRHLLFALILFGFAALLPLFTQDYGNRLLNAGIIAAIAVIGLNFVFGYAGSISLGHAAFVGLAAYCVALLTTRLGWNPWLAGLVAVAFSSLCGYVVGWILLRLKGHYLALATLGLNVSFTIVAANWQQLTGGTNGISGVPPLSLGGIVLGDERSFYWFSLILLFLLSVFAFRVRNSHAGRAFMAVRDDELATEMTGLPTIRIKVLAFTLGTGYAAIAGCLFAYHQHFVSPDDFSFSHSIIFLAMLVVGGEGRIAGAILGAIGVTLLPELLRGVGDAYLAVFGVLVLVVLVVLPRGLISLFEWSTYRTLCIRIGMKVSGLATDRRQQ
jgi:branched-chain amino acid transport system permease protein